MQSPEDLLQLFDNLSQRESPFWNGIILGFCKSHCCSLCRSIRFLMFCYEYNVVLKKIKN
ncbi:hypothetical protein ACS0TY_029969 [Phlomoides rotata]